MFHWSNAWILLPPVIWRHMVTSCRYKIQVSWVSEELPTFRKHRHPSKPGQVHALTQTTSQPSHNDANFHLGSVIPEIPTRFIVGLVWLNEQPLLTQTVVFIMGMLIVLWGKTWNFEYDSHNCHIHTDLLRQGPKLQKQLPTITNNFQIWSWGLSQNCQD